MGLLALLCPADGSFHSLFQLRVLAGEWRTLIEAHYYIGAEPILNLGCDLGVEIYLCTIYVAGEFDAVIINPSKATQRKDLIASAVGQKGAVPGHKFVQAAERLDCIDSGPQQQMVSIGQNDTGAGLFELLWGNSLYHTGGAHRAESRRLDLSVGGRQQTLPSCAAAVLTENLEELSIFSSQFSIVNCQYIRAGVIMGKYLLCASAGSCHTFGTTLTHSHAVAPTSA